jgi:hypothetical protein
VNERYNVTGDRAELYVHRAKALLLVFGSLAFALLVLVVALSGGAPWWIWLTLLLMFGAPVVIVRRYGFARLFRRKPALVIDAKSLHDRVTGIEVSWDDVERLVPWEQSSTQRWLGVVARDERAFLAHQGSAARIGASLDRALHLSDATLNIPLTLLAADEEEIVALIRRFWDGPIEDYPVERTNAPGFGVRHSRARRFLSAVGGWVMPLAIGLGVTALWVWLS